jgi:hypothetical protein
MHSLDEADLLTVACHGPVEQRRGDMAMLASSCHCGAVRTKSLLMPSRQPGAVDPVQPEVRPPDRPFGPGDWQIWDSVADDDGWWTALDSTPLESPIVLLASQA